MTSSIPATNAVTRSNARWQIIRPFLGYLLQGKALLRDGHLPVAGHVVPADFAGVGVATAPDPAIDDYVIDHLKQLGVRQVRLDFSYADSDRHTSRFLERLLAESFSVDLHVFQPYDEARRMEFDERARQHWHAFLRDTLDRYGAAIKLVEIGSTINRPRWAGYSLEGFLIAWDIAYREVKRRSLRLAGPNITDFEPAFNIAVLDKLKQRGQLPDVHTNNLFSERCMEPERFDHKVLGHLLARSSRFNLVKKARLLKKITSEYGIPALMSPSAFWTLPRISRVLWEAEQKQADYLVRYLVLCAASGALEKAFWGPLICHREGLIDEGDYRYTELERITHYADLRGSPAEYRPRRSFEAMRTFCSRIPGKHYDGPLHTTHGLEIHAFSSDTELMHVVWKTNGNAIALRDLYGASDLSEARCANRDGLAIEQAPDFATESPLYLNWTLPRTVCVRPHFGQHEVMSLHGHDSAKRFYHFEDGGWRGAIAASDAAEAELLRTQLHPERLSGSHGTHVLRKARNAVWKIPHPAKAGEHLVVKQPVRMYAHKRLQGQFKPSKAKRSWNSAHELLRRGIDTAAPVAYFERIGDRSLTQNLFICDYVDTTVSVRECFMALAQGETEFMGVPAPALYEQLAGFLLAMHNRGVFFRDLSGGNILVQCQPGGTLHFSLIDTNRAHFFNHGTRISKRLSDLARICHKLHWEGRVELLGIYFEALGRKLTLRHRLPFYLYDAKVGFKRVFGRKGFKRLRNFLSARLTQVIMLDGILELTAWLDGAAPL